jgi:hypothetical protein
VTEGTEIEPPVAFSKTPGFNSSIYDAIGTKRSSSKVSSVILTIGMVLCSILLYDIVTGEPTPFELLPPVPTPGPSSTPLAEKKD